MNIRIEFAATIGRVQLIQELNSLVVGRCETWGVLQINRLLISQWSIVLYDLVGITRRGVLGMKC
ncbi:MAG TPA: hypothetical protein DD473_26670 [Planctomycetaceae bacterium]|nr:hypothetical protein [Planctomycetaceae bacterium]